MADKNFRNTKMSEWITIEENAQELRLILDGEKVQKKNMQEAGNAFEGWAVAAKACLINEGENKNVVLDVKPGVHYNQAFEMTASEGHLARFLYRAMKFDEQYDWFELSESLVKEVKSFKEFLNSGTFINNIASCEASNTDREDENTIEDILSQGKNLKKLLGDVVDIGNNSVYRQLPVGLFKDDVKTENSIFTRGKSSIDLWTYNHNEISVVELKFKNRMIGIITEIFFYSNYMYDFVTKKGWFCLNPDIDKTNARGYEKLTVNGYDTINGILLADENGFHPLVNEKSIDVLNSGCNEHIRYFLCEYGFRGEVYKV